MKKIVYLIGDSLCCSRPNESVSMSDLYSFRMQTELGDNLVVIDRSSPSNTTTISLNNSIISNDLSTSHIDLLIVHLGIVDCFPRTLYEHYYHFFSFFESVRYTSKITKFIKRLLSKKRVNSVSMKPFVQLDCFEKNISALLKLARNKNSKTKALIIDICSPGKFLVGKCRDIEQIIENYNDLIIKKFSHDPNNIIIQTKKIGLSNYLTQDGHHIISQGHDVLFQEIKKQLKNENLI